jgi:hypothetical protein
VTLLPPLSPSVRFQHCCLSLSRAGSTAVYTVPGGLFQHCCFPKLPAQDVLEGLVRPTFHKLAFMTSTLLGP